MVVKVKYPLILHEFDASIREATIPNAIVNDIGRVLVSCPFIVPHCYLPALIKNTSLDECAVL